MGYLAAWRILEEMIVDFRKNGIAPPVQILNDLKSARTMMSVSRTDPCYGETTQRIGEYLDNVEFYLFSEGQKKLGDEYVDKWLWRLSEAKKKISEEEAGDTRFVLGLPREQKWIRVKPSIGLTGEKLGMLSKECNLLIRVQDDGSILVYGKEERIREFVKKMAMEYESKTLK